MKNAEEPLDSPRKNYLSKSQRRLVATAALILGVIFIGKISGLDAAGRCALSLAVDGPGAILPTNTLTYGYTLKNTGAIACRDILVSVYYGQNESYASAIPAPTSLDYFWRIDALKSRKTYALGITTNYVPTATLPTVSNEICAAPSNGKTVCATTETPVVISSTPISNTATTTSSIPTDASTTSVVAVLPPDIAATTPAATSSSGSATVSGSGGGVLPSPVASTSTSATQIVVTPEPVSTPASTESVPEKEYGVWVWDSPLMMGQAKGRSVIDSAVANNFNVMYVTIDDILSIASMQDGVAKDAAQTSYMNTLNTFIAYAASKGIAVDVEGGWKDWAEPGNEWKANAILDFATAYNAAYQNKIRHVQYDIEPYLLARYETNKASVLTNYVKLIDSLVTRDTANIGIEIAIPHFYGSEDGLPSITLNGKTASPFTHLLTSLDRRPGNSIDIMSYRNYMEGAGGVIAIVEDEMAEASSGSHTTKVILAQETGNVDPAFVTFYGKTKAELLAQLQAISDYYASFSGFGGTAVHYIDPFLALP